MSPAPGEDDSERNGMPNGMKRSYREDSLSETDSPAPTKKRYKRPYRLARLRP